MSLEPGRTILDNPWRYTEPQNRKDNVGLDLEWQAEITPRDSALKELRIYLHTVGNTLLMRSKRNFDQKEIKKVLKPK